MIILGLMLLLGIGVQAQDNQPQEKTSHWKANGNIGLNFSQGAYTNWAAGGQNSLAWQGIFNYTLNYANGKFKWDNTLNTSLGYNHFDFRLKPIKTDDKIEFTSLVGFKATEKWFYSLELAFRSQFAYGFDYKTDSTQYISKFLAPAYVNLGLGVEWTPNEHFTINFAPLTARITIVNDDYLASIGAFGVNSLDPYDTTIHAKSDKVRFEFGARMTAKMQYTIIKNVDFESKLELFSNYLKDPQYIDVDWQNLLILKVNSWLNCNLATHLIYDRDVPFYNPDPVTGEPVRVRHSKVQFKEVLSIGVMINI